jgi:hypothetical protein
MNFTNLMAQDFATIFGQNQAILGSLKTALEPIISAGPNQTGFSAPEEAAMRTQASDAITQGTQNAQIAANAKEAAAGGGGAFVPSGANQQIGEMVNTQGAIANANQQENITQANYATGRQNFNTAIGELVGGAEGLAGASSGFGGAVSGSENAATGAASSSMEGATQIQQANSSWMAPVMGAIGAIGGAALGGPLGASLGSSLGNSLGGGNTNLPLGPGFGSGQMPSSVY